MASKYHVLIVEDEHDIAGLIKHTLERGGDAQAEIVSSGDAALKAVAERPPDLVILDLNLPVLSGLEVCRILRARADARHIPIIMLTARTTENDRVGGLELGADDYVTKRSAFASSPRASAPCCWNGSEGTSDSSKRARWTVTWAGSAGSWARRDARSRP
jgi:CheY-like chemotaxis protein